MCTAIQDIKSQIHELFDPLAEKLGLHTFFESEQSQTVFSIAFASDDLGLELNVDLADFFVYAMLFRPVGTVLPIGYQDSFGNRQKLYVQEALKELGVEIGDTTHRLQQLGGDRRNCSGMLVIIKEMVEVNWSALKADRARLFGDTA